MATLLSVLAMIGVMAAATPRLAVDLNVPAELPIMGYGLTDALGGLVFDEPVAIAAPPSETNRLFIVERKGTVQVITNLAAPDKTLFLDVRDTTYAGFGEAGLLGFAFHPGYATNSWFFLYRTRHRVGPDNRFGLHDQLTRLQTSPDNPHQADESSEVDLIVQFDHSEEHNAGDIQFGPDGYLYLSLGDRAPAASELIATYQPIDKSFFGAIIRIDVDQRADSLLPNPHASVVGNYRIPPDNPFVGRTEHQGRPVNPQQVRTEFYAIGFRNPWRMAFDPGTGRLYAGDVGGGSFEEVVLVESGANHGWPYREGPFRTSLADSAPPGASFDLPLHYYVHGYATNEGRAIIGGPVYRGAAIPQLTGRYLFADNVAGHIWALQHTGRQVTKWLRLTGSRGVSTFGIDPRNSEVLIGNVADGTIKQLVYVPEDVVVFPKTLAETGIFTDLTNLTPAPGVEPYEINVPFWSDNAIKTRWFALPDPSTTIGFRAEGNWQFPAGMLWVKHFELELIKGVTASRRRLETRLLAKTESGVYGVTYRWGEFETNAFLVPDHGEDKVFFIFGEGGVRSQVWHYPTRQECIVCHSGVGGSALGFNTYQLNIDVPEQGENRLELLEASGYFDGPIPPSHQLQALSHSTNSAAPLQERVRSYLAANCSQCHYPGSWTGAPWDARFTTPMAEANIVNRTGLSSSRLVVPGDANESLLLSRVAHLGFERMPPIASSVLNTSAINLLQNWINTLPAFPWTNTNIGADLRGGSASVDGLIIRVSGSGHGIGSLQDQFHFLYRRLAANGQIVARLDNISGDNGLAGIVLRTHLQPDARQTSLLAGHDRIRVFTRGESGGTSEVAEFPGGHGWLRLAREGSSVSSWASNDGESWQQLTSESFLPKDSVWIGLASTSADVFSISTAEFSQVNVREVSLEVELIDSQAPGTLNLQAIVTGDTSDISRVIFYSGDTQIGTATQSPYQRSWTNAWAGPHQILVRVFGSTGLSLASQSVSVEIDPITLQDWRVQHFSAAQLIQPEISADWADYDLDGLPTLLEYLLGLDPKTPSQTSPFLTRLEEDALVLEFDLDPRAGEATYLLEGSSDLDYWETHSVTETRRVTPGNRQRLILRAPLESASPTYFFRWGAQRR